MYIQEELINKIEKLEKEIWFLVKNKLPALKDEIIAQIGQGGGNKDLLDKINANTNNITQILTDIESINNLITSINTTLTANQESISNLNTSVATNQENIANINKAVDSNKTEIANNAKAISDNTEQIASNSQQIATNTQQLADNQADIERCIAKADSAANNFSSTIGRLNELNNRVADIYVDVKSNTEDIASMTDNIAEVRSKIDQSAVNVSNLTNKVASNTTTLQTLSSQVEQNTTKLGTVESDITSTNQKVSSVEDRVKTLENSGGGGGRVSEVIYDMNSADAAINQGFTTGMVTNNAIYWQKDYDFIRVYASLNGNAGYAEVPLKNTVRDDFMVVGVNATGKSMNYMRGFVFKTQKRINAGLRFTYTVGSDGNITFDSSSNNKFFFSRIEGIIGV